MLLSDEDSNVVSVWLYTVGPVTLIDEESPHVRLFRRLDAMGFTTDVTSWETDGISLLSFRLVSGTVLAHMLSKPNYSGVQPSTRRV